MDSHQMRPKVRDWTNPKSAIPGTYSMVSCWNLIASCKDQTTDWPALVATVKGYSEKLRGRTFWFGFERRDVANYTSSKMVEARSVLVRHCSR